ncbi:CBO0543 family protein [Niallia taxi]|uniref:CBO0543 family protein n=1 Tax=Niallia taxi TaxID=2499688 RepID=UPI00254C4914|nr:CBO0543 family protein [Niallia taxi]MDK8641245.1 CBO0543 family protein [Niallia taxi]
MIFLIQGMASSSEIMEAKKHLVELTINHWLNYDLFSIQWWILVGATIIPYFIWWRLVNIKRFYEIFSYGLLCGCFSIVLDIIGTEMLLWSYPDKLLPWIPPLIPADLVMIPITAMLVYQYTNKWKTFLIGTILWAALFSYIFEPLFVEWNMFMLGDNWKHSYSFIGFILLGIVLRAIFKGIKLGLMHSLKDST